MGMNGDIQTTASLPQRTSSFLQIGGWVHPGDGGAVRVFWRW